MLLLCAAVFASRRLAMVAFIGVFFHDGLARAYFIAFLVVLIHVLVYLLGGIVLGFDVIAIGRVFGRTA